LAYFEVIYMVVMLLELLRLHVARAVLAASTVQKATARLAVQSNRRLT
jgi:hypothetical protein